MVNEVTVNYYLAKRQQEMVKRRRRRRRGDNTLCVVQVRVSFRWRHLLFYFLYKNHTVLKSCNWTISLILILSWGSSDHLCIISLPAAFLLSLPVHGVLCPVSFGFFWRGEGVFPSCCCLFLSCDALLHTASCLHRSRRNIVPVWRRRHFTGYHVFSMGPISL